MPSPDARQTKTRWIHIDVHNAILDRSKSSGAGRTLLLVMADHCDENGECDASVRVLAKDCNVSDRAIQETRKKLVQMGELEPLEAGGGIATARFRISCFRPVHKSSPVKKPSPVHKHVVTGEDLRSSPVKKPSPQLIKIPKSLKEETPLTPLSGGQSSKPEPKFTKRERERMRRMGVERPQLVEHTHAVCRMCGPPHEWAMPESSFETAMPEAACPDYRSRLKRSLYPALQPRASPG